MAALRHSCSMTRSGLSARLELFSRSASEILESGWYLQNWLSGAASAASSYHSGPARDTALSRPKGGTAVQARETGETTSGVSRLFSRKTGSPSRLPRFPERIRGNLPQSAGVLRLAPSLGRNMQEPVRSVNQSCVSTACGTNCSIGDWLRQGLTRQHIPRPWQSAA